MSRGGHTFPATEASSDPDEAPSSEPAHETGVVHAVVAGAEPDCETMAGMITVVAAE